MEQSNSKGIFKTISAIVITLGIIASSYIVADGIVRARGNVKGNENLITVTGSAKQEIKSDLIVWNCYYSANAPSTKEAYSKLNENTSTVKSYLIEKGIKSSDIILSSVSIMPVYRVEQRKNYSGETYDYTTNQVESYTLEQTIEVKSKDVDKVTEISRNSTELISQGINLRSSSPQYFYTKLSDLKISMLAKATADARDRADKMAANAGAKCGKLRSANMGVFQITPQYSNEVSDYGINDTSSLEKEIMSVVSCRFEIK